MINGPGLCAALLRTVLVFLFIIHIIKVGGLGLVRDQHGLQLVLALPNCQLLCLQAQHQRQRQLIT